MKCHTFFLFTSLFLSPFSILAMNERERPSTAPVTVPASVQVRSQSTGSVDTAGSSSGSTSPSNPSFLGSSPSSRMRNILPLRQSFGI